VSYPAGIRGLRSPNIRLDVPKMNSSGTTSYWYGTYGSFATNFFAAIPAWQLLRLGENFFLEKNLQSPASLDALRAGLEGAKDGLSGK
jgi:hypothetical protein